MIDNEFPIRERFQEELFYLSDLLWGDKSIECVDKVTFAVEAPVA